VLKPHYVGLCAPEVEGNQCGVVQLAGLGPADFTYLLGPTFEPTGAMGCFSVDGTFTIALESDGSSVTGPAYWRLLRALHVRTRRRQARLRESVQRG